MTWKISLSAVLYAAFVFCANPVWAGDVDLAAIAELRAGDMKKLVVHDAPKPVRPAGVFDAEGGEVLLEAYHGKVVVLNFWATWCAPCRAEMPSLDRLQADLGGDDFAVVTVATGRNPLPLVQRFFAETQIAHLPILLDPKQALSRANGVFGLPTTLILDREGREIGRLQGDADWYGTDAVKVLQAVIDGG